MTDQNKNEPIFMLNALWFKKDGGEEKYAKYLEAVGPLVLKHGGKPGDKFKPGMAIYGKLDADLIFIVEYPNQAAFIALTQEPSMEKISALRAEAIEDSWLIQLNKI